jgi:hypothetical protein
MPQWSSLPLQSTIPLVHCNSLPVTLFRPQTEANPIKCNIMATSPVKINAYPAKKFFVDMLIRDIELKDAILDLLDNCIDGAMRIAARTEQRNSHPYAGQWAKIAFNENEFSIEDNCGGISTQLARASAFRLGRVDSTIDAGLPTVGVYGIGMKRAIFKLGRESTVESRTESERFTVEISRAWMEDDGDWQLPISEGQSSLDHAGTRITVKQLRDGVPRLLSDETDFVEDLKKTIAAYYGLIIEKGFDVTVNEGRIEPTQVALLLDEGTFTTNEGIVPYVYEAEQDGVSVSVVIGFYRDLPSDDEEEEALQGRPTSEKAGITVICNDRVVVYADKTRLTGWGEATVPQYHTQFVSIAGQVSFHSNDASKLPLTTTKRGLDGNSDLFLTVKDSMREGLKYFTDFTNKWKKSKRERTEVHRRAKAWSPLSVSTQIPANRWSDVHKGLGGRKYKPQLPLPKEDDPIKQIRFSRRQSDIAAVSSYLFDDPNTSPSDVGGKCFDDALARAKR